MSFALLSGGGVDRTLLIRAAAKASSLSLEQLDHSSLRAIAKSQGIDFATAVLYQCARREHRTCAERIDQLYRKNDEADVLPTAQFLYVPNLGYFADPKSQAVGTAICAAARDFGCNSKIVPTSATASLAENARIVLQSLADCGDKPIILASVSKGSADVKMALRADSSGDTFRNVLAWIDVCGLSDGSPLVNALKSDEEGRLEKIVQRWFRARGVPYVREVLENTKELGYGPDYPLDGPLEIPSQIWRLGVVGFPASWHFAFQASRVFHQAISEYGPNDSYGLLKDMLTKPGDIYPIWGTDHYFEAHLDIPALAKALFGYVAERLRAWEPLSAPQALTLPPTIQPTKATGELPDAKDAPTNMPRGEHASEHDWARLRHARARHEGFAVGRYLQPAPMIFTRDGHNVFLGDMYRGRSAFLIAGGPSLNGFDLSLLQRRGILTCAVNNAAAVFRPHLWVSIDDPGNFVDVVWRDPGITKFVPLCHMEKHFTVRDGAGELVPSSELVGDMPAVFGYRRNERFQPEQWLYEDTFNWGNHSRTCDSDGNRGSRSVMYVAIRLLFYLGIRRLFLLGCDFRMQEGISNYAFPQDRSVSSIRGNNSSYQVLNQRLTRLKPYFEREGYEIFNCTANSGLTAFPHASFDEALAAASGELPAIIDTSGMYDRQQRQRDRQAKNVPRERLGRTKKPGTHPAAPSPELTLITSVSRRQVIKFGFAWPTWLRPDSLFSNCRIIVVHDHDVDLQSPQFDPLRSRSNCRFVVSKSECLDEALATQSKLLRLVQSEISTPWFALISPETVYKGSKINLGTVLARAVEQAPLQIIDSRDCRLHAGDERSLRTWLETRVEKAPRHFAKCGQAEQLAVPFGQMRLARNPVCYFANSSWARVVSSDVEGDLPCSDMTSFLSFCAAWLEAESVTFDMKQLGLQRIAESDRRLLRRANNGQPDFAPTAVQIT